MSREPRVKTNQRQGLLNCMVGRNLNLLINSAVSGICYVQDGEQRKLLELEYGQLGEGVSMKLKEKIYDACVRECWYMVSRRGL